MDILAISHTYSKRSIYFSGFYKVSISNGPSFVLIEKKYINVLLTSWALILRVFQPSHIDKK